MDDSLIDALAEGDVQPLTAWLTARGVDAEELLQLPRWNSDPALATVPSSRRPADRKERLRSCLAEDLPKVAGQPGGVAVLILYIKHCVEEAWEISYHFGPLWDTLRATRECVLGWGMPAEPAEAALTRASLALLTCVDREILAENEMSCGLWLAQAEAARGAADAARTAVGHAAVAEADHPELAVAIREEAESVIVLYDAVALSARGTHDFLRHGTDLAPVIAALAAAERALDGDADNIGPSELRAHRFSLLALQEAKDTGRPWLTIQHGLLHYVYPFAVRGSSRGQVVTSVRERARGWAIAGAETAAVHRSLDLDDVWDGADPLGNRYEGAYIELPEVVLRGLDGTELARLQAQVRFSELGNHCVRFHTEVTNTPAADLYSLMYLAAPEFGVQEVTFEAVPAGGAPRQVFSRLSELAMAVVGDVCARLRESAGADALRATARPGTFQLIVAVDAASVTDDPGGLGPQTEVMDPATLYEAMGSQILARPVPHLIGAPAEWSRQPAGLEPDALAGELYGGHFRRTVNTSVLVCLGSADFVVGTQVTVAEFTASLDGLFEGWQSELAVHYEKTRELMTALDQSGAAPAPSLLRLRQLAGGLEQKKAQLEDFIVETRSTILLLQSPTLLSSPVAADQLRVHMERSGVLRRADELRARTDEVAHEQLGAGIERIAVRRAVQQRTKLDILLAVIAAAGISGVIQVLQGGLGAGSTQALWAVIGVAGIVLVAVTLGVWAVRSVGRAT
jgi:hypothetical protein